MNEISIDQLVKEYIPYLQAEIQIDPINKGYSGDSKHVVVKDNRKYLLRTYDYKLHRGKQMEYEALLKMEEYGVNCSRPLHIGSIEDHGIGYMILTYIEGNDASDELPKLSVDDQYRLGFEAGIELFKITQLVAPNHITSWYDRKITKHRKCMDEYSKLAIRVNNDASIITFIEENLALMKNRPNLFQHDDFHVGNLIINDRGELGVIDFNRCDWGDPVHEFLKVGLFSSEVSIPFSIGQIRGYHDNQDPDELFWRLYSLYLAMNVFSSVVWILKVKPEEIGIMMEKLIRVLDDHNHFDLIKPKWYLER
ncbi:MAG: aminoglycoside phosphotransferase family protein [Bacilli bacterium]